MEIAGTNYNLVRFPRPRTELAIEWVKARYWHGSDRGSAQDVYESDVSIYDTEANVNALQDTLEANREGITLGAFTTGELILGANVDYSSTISATVVDFGVRKNRDSYKMYSMDIVFRAISVSTLSTPAASLASLRWQEGFEGDQSWEIDKNFSMTGVASYADKAADTGRFQGSFRQTNEEMKAIRRYLIETARGNTITLPTFSNVTYPFGKPKGSGPFNCKIKSWNDRRINQVFWDLEIEFVEAP